jgi:hypothetical protein
MRNAGHRTPARKTRRCPNFAFGPKWKGGRSPNRRARVTSMKLSFQAEAELPGLGWLPAPLSGRFKFTREAHSLHCRHLLLCFVTCGGSPMVQGGRDATEKSNQSSVKQIRTYYKAMQGSPSAFLRECQQLGAQQTSVRAAVTHSHARSGQINSTRRINQRRPHLPAVSASVGRQQHTSKLCWLTRRLLHSPRSNHPCPRTARHAPNALLHSSSPFAGAPAPPPSWSEAASPFPQLPRLGCPLRCGG